MTKTNTKTNTKTKTKSKFIKYLTCAIFSKNRGCKDIKYDFFIIVSNSESKVRKSESECQKVRNTRSESQ